MQQQPLIADTRLARDVISMHAYTSGLKAGGLTALVSGSAVLAANKYSPKFRARLGASGKTGLVVSSFLGAFAIVSEKRLLAGARNPDKYLASLDPGYVEVQLQDAAHGLRWHHRVANFVYDHPYRSLVSVGVPLVGSIFALQATNTAISRSQQIMHTRIYGQGAVVVLLLASMGFHDYMHQRGGPFVAPDARKEEEETPAH
jgi:hypothetical protein